MQALAGAGPAPALAAAAALLGALAAAAVADPIHIVPSAALAAAMAAIAAEDFRRFRVPDAWNLFAALAGLATVWHAARAAGSDPFAAIGSAAVAALVCSGALFLVRETFLRLRGVDGLGLGDVKLAATAGLWLGWQAFPHAVMLAAVSALAYVALCSWRDGPWPRGRKIPFALHLAPAIWLCWLWTALAPLAAGGAERHFLPALLPPG